MNGKELSLDLARHLSNNAARMVWTEVGLGPTWYPMSKEASRADVLTIEKSYVHPLVRIYEVKADKSDFWHDVNSGKYEKYLEHCSQFYFACPSGILKRDEVPANCGLIVRGDSSWSVVKGAKARAYKPTYDLLMAVLMHGFTQWNEGWRQWEKEHLLHFTDFKTLSRDFGMEVSEAIQDAGKLVATGEKLKQDLEQFAGREYTDIISAMYELRSEVERLQRKHRYSKFAVQLAGVVDRLFQGTYFWTADVAKVLREVAGAIEQEQERERLAALG